MRLVIAAVTRFLTPLQLCLCHVTVVSELSSVCPRLIYTVLHKLNKSVDGTVPIHMIMKRRSI